PATPTEARIADIWRELLGVDAIGMHDSFFALGGHSLVATRLFARMSEAFGTSLPLRWIFEAPSVRELARRVDAQLAQNGSGQTAVDAIDAGAGGRHALSYPQQ